MPYQYVPGQGTIYLSDFAAENLRFQTGSGSYFTTAQAPPSIDFSAYSPLTASASPALTPEAESTISGIEPQALSAILYGKDVPVFVGGKARIGGRIIEGPFFGGTAEAPTVSYIASHALCANPSGTRTITEFSLRGRVAWTAVDGALLDGLTVEFKTGSETQTPFASSVTRYGTSAIAYRGHILSCVTDLPLSTFAGVVPFPSVLVEDSSFGDPDDGITRQDALETILRYARLEDDEFEVDVTGADIAWIIGQKAELIPFLRSLRKIFVNWNITATDKLRIIEPAAFTVDVDVTRDNTIAGSLRFRRVEPLIKPREKIYRFIDIARDYEPNAATARQELFPFPTTLSVESETIELPIVTDASQAIVDVNYALFQEEVARKRLEGVGMVSLLGLEAGDGTSFSDHAHFRFRGRISETVKNAADWTIDFKAETWLNCALPPDSDISNVVLLLGFDYVDGSVSITDESPAEHGLALVRGDAQADTAHSKYGGGSLLLDGTDDSITYADSDDWNFSGAFTIEAFIRPASVTGTQFIIGKWQGSGTQGWILYIDGAALKWNVSTTGADSLDDLSGGSVTVGTWQHVCVDYDLTTYRLYVDGAMVDSSTTSRVIFAPDVLLAIGSNELGNAFHFNGSMDEIRITNGEARYASDAGFSAPSAKFSRE